MPADLEHPLIDGNKRAAWAALVMFVDLNQGSWHPDPPDVGQAEQAMLAIAAHEVDEAWTEAWLRERVRFVGRDRPFATGSPGSGTFDRNPVGLT